MLAAGCILVFLLVTVVFYTVGRRLYADNGRVELVVLLTIVYFWTFAGSVFFVIDSIVGFHGYEVGLSYYYLMEKMFPFQLDADYLVSMLFYAVFGLVLCGTLFVFRKTNAAIITGGTVRVSVPVLLGITCVAALFSLMGAQEALTLGLQGKMSFYEAKQQLTPGSAKLFELANGVMVMSLFIGIALLLTSETNTAQVLYVQRKGWMKPAYIGLLALVLVYLTLLGDRSSLFTGFLWAGMYMYQLGGRQVIPKLGALLVICLLILLPGSALRGLVFSSAPLQTEIKDPFSVESIAHVPRKAENGIQRLGNLVLSNEMFAAHFSMYGCLSKEVEPDPLVSFRYLWGRVIRDSAMTERTSYLHYVEGVGAQEGQGYTIHHATAWYLNAGMIGVPIGALFLGLIYVLFMKIGHLVRSRPIAGGLAAFLPISMVSYLPALVRSGPEAYKALLMEGLGIPMLVLLLATVACTVFNSDSQ